MRAQLQRIRLRRTYLVQAIQALEAIQTLESSKRRLPGRACADIYRSLERKGTAKRRFPTVDPLV